MQKALIGKKIGMTQIFDEKGKVVPVTVVEAGPCVVSQVKTVETDGYTAIQMGYGDVKPKHVTKPLQGHFKKADVAPKRVLKEFRFDDCSAYELGQVIKAETQGISRYRPERSSRRLHGRLLLSLQSLEGQEDGRPPRR